jgi:hypothetical protein
MEEEPPANELTRPPDDRDLAVLARELNCLGARYVVIGGVAINRLGFIRATDDLDLLVARDLANQALIKKALGALVAKTKEPWWDFCELVADLKPKRSHSEAHALSIWRVTRTGELKYLHYEDPDLDPDEG